MVLKINVKIGDSVKKGDVVCILEAMKMESEIFADKSGVVENILVNPGDIVNQNDLIMIIGDSIDRDENKSNKENKPKPNEEDPKDRKNEFSKSKNDKKINSPEKMLDKLKNNIKVDKILFVDGANISISPIAEAIFNKKVKGIKAYSAGLSAISGNKAVPNAIKVCENHDIDLSSHCTANIEDYDLDDSTLILSSTTYIRNILKYYYHFYKVVTINEFAGFSNLDIEDPFWSDMEAFETCFSKINDAIDEIFGLNILEKDDMAFSNKEENNNTPLTPNKEDINKINSFKYLDDLIHSNKKNITLDSDIVYMDGDSPIILDVNDILIDGRGHAIDAKGKCGIFNITGKNITIKNIVLKNGFVESDGVICNKGKVTLENISVKNNRSSKYEGNAIVNKKYPDPEKIEGMTAPDDYSETMAEMTIRNSIIENNSARNGGAILNDGKLFIEKTTFKNNLAFTAGAISNGGYVSLKDVSMENNIAVSGAAFVNGGDAKIEDSFIIKNIAISEKRGMNGEHDVGGAVGNSDNLLLKNTSFINNSSPFGSAIYNLGIDIPKLKYLCKIKIEDCRFENNSSHISGEIHNEIGEISIDDSKFKNEIAKRGSVIYNDSYLTITSCDFKDLKKIVHNFNLMTIHSSNFESNQSDSAVIENDGEIGILSIEKGKIANNISDYATVYNHGKDCSITGTIFENNRSKKENCHNICNRSNMVLKEIILKDNSVSIFNEGILTAEKKYKNFISSVGKVFYLGMENEFNFSYLDELIHSNISNTISFDEDISLLSDEFDFYEGGIELDRDNMVIDGKGKTIDASGKSRIFLVTGNNITLKNIIFKNGHAFDNYFMSNNEGGAIKVFKGLDLKIENCKFIDNISESKGGAIHNKGYLTISNGLFESNKSNEGGAIYNHQKLSIIDTCFKGNEGHIGGAIYNKEDLEIVSTKFLKNIVKESLFKARFIPILQFEDESFGGAIFNKKRMLIKQSSFKKNMGLDDTDGAWGGAIRTIGDEEVTIIQTEFIGNYLKDSNFGGAISSLKTPNLIDCTFSDNYPNDLN